MIVTVEKEKPVSPPTKSIHVEFTPGEARRLWASLGNYPDGANIAIVWGLYKALEGKINE